MTYVDGVIMIMLIVGAVSFLTIRIVILEREIGELEKIAGVIECQGLKKTIRDHSL